VVASGGVTTIPFGPIVIVAGIAAGTIVAIKLINKSGKYGKVNKLERTDGDDRFYVQGFGGEYWSAEPTTGQLKCSSRNVQEWETMQVMQTEAGRYVFRASNSRYVSVDPNGTLVANQADIENSEPFTIEEHDDSFVAFKTSCGKYVSRREDEGGLLKAMAAAAKEWELFRLMVMKDQIIITETVTVKQTLSINIDVLNYSEITKRHVGWLRGTFYNIFSPMKAKQEIKRRIMEDLGRELRPRIEEMIKTELSTRLGREVAAKMKQELAKRNIQANVEATAMPMPK
jgi:predicted DNA-binding transcriptional regulator